MRGPGKERTYGDEEVHTESDVLSDDEYEWRADADRDAALAEFKRRIEEELRVRVLTVAYDDGEWQVGFDEEPGDGPSKFRFCLGYEADSLEVDMPVEVLQRIAERIHGL